MTLCCARKLAENALSRFYIRGMRFLFCLEFPDTNSLPIYFNRRGPWLSQITAPSSMAYAFILRGRLPVAFLPPIARIVLAAGEPKIRRFVVGWIAVHMINLFVIRWIRSMREKPCQSMAIVRDTIYTNQNIPI